MNAVTIQSLMDIRFLSGVAVSPDGARTAYVESSRMSEQTRYESRIRVRDNQTGAVTRLTHAGRESSFNLGR